MSTTFAVEVATTEERSCCTPNGGARELATTATPLTETPEDFRRTVREGYGQIARGESASCCGSRTRGGGAGNLAAAVGYDEADLARLPEGANMGLSCGNPTALAELKAGESVVDLGAGGGFDIFIAGERVGTEGRAIGVDMTADMIERARAGISVYHQRTGLDNVEFRLGEIEHLPLADASVDVVISNCVINLSPHKAQVWREIARVLKPGGRVAVSDLALKRELPVLVSDTEVMVRDAGLTDLQLEPRDGYIAAMEEWQDPLYAQIVEHLPPDTTPADFVTSLSVSARKPLAHKPGA
jgi:ubiquinone/menaquinone biosynthesis C-methylase UbiE